jgi:hypothetical protein
MVTSQKWRRSEGLLLPNLPNSIHAIHWKTQSQLIVRACSLNSLYTARFLPRHPSTLHKLVLRHYFLWKRSSENQSALSLSRFVPLVKLCLNAKFWNLSIIILNVYSLSGSANSELYVTTLCMGCSELLLVCSCKRIPQLWKCLAQVWHIRFLLTSPPESAQPVL